LISQIVFKELFRGVGQLLAFGEEREEREKILSQSSGASDEREVWASVLPLEFSAFHHPQQTKTIKFF
jgi:hypothetical protein